MNKLLPQTSDEFDAMVDTVAGWIDLVHVWLSSEGCRQRLQFEIERAIDGGTIPLMNVIAAAEAGHSGADWALRVRASELLDSGKLDRDSSAQLRAFVIRALLREPTSYPAGKNVADTWTRDIAIAVLVSLAAIRWNLRVTRNRISKRPCAASVVAAALAKCADLLGGSRLGEQQVARIHAAHERLAARLANTFPTVG